MKIRIETVVTRLTLEEEIHMIKNCEGISTEERTEALNKLYALVN